MAYYLFNLADGDRAEAAARLAAKMWGVGEDEVHGDDLAPGDVVLIYVAGLTGTLIGRAELASPVHEWTPSEADASPARSTRGVLLTHVEEWDPAVPMTEVVRRIDPTGSNPLVQKNAAFGFPMGVVRITEHEYDSALAVSRERQRA